MTTMIDRETHMREALDRALEGYSGTSIIDGYRLEHPLGSRNGYRGIRDRFDAMVGIPTTAKERYRQRAWMAARMRGLGYEVVGAKPRGIQAYDN